jgi:hypothetical protein
MARCPNHAVRRRPPENAGLAGQRRLPLGFIMDEHVLKDKLFKWASNVNLGYIVRFHEFIMGELKRKETELANAISGFEGDRKTEVDLRIERDLFASTYRYHMVNNTFLMLYSHLEEWLYHIWKTYGRTVDLNGKKRGSVSRFSPVLQHVLNIDLSSDRNWQFVVEAEKIRNCLLHANGRIDLSTNSEDLRQIVVRRKNLLSESNSRVNLTQAYIERFFECVQNIILRVESPQET